MDYPSDLLFRLPQSVVRGLGIVNLDFMKFSQVDVNRSDTDFSSTPWHQSVREMNFDILNSVYPSVCIDTLNLRDFNIALPKVAAVDFNLISSISIYPNLRKIKSIFALPYSSHVSSPKIIDLYSFKSFLRCLKASYTLSENIKIDYYYDWSSMILKEKSNCYLPWFWKAEGLSHDLYLARIQKVVKVFSSKFAFFRRFINSTSPILILATELPEGPSFIDKIEYLYKSSTDFKKMIDEGGSEIFLKSHRTHPFPRSLVPSNYKGTPIIVAEELSETVIPAELFLNSGKNLLLAAEFGSSIFNFQVNKFSALPLPTDSWTIPSYGLIVKRMEKYLDISLEYKLAQLKNTKQINSQ